MKGPLCEDELVHLSNRIVATNRYRKRGHIAGSLTQIALVSWTSPAALHSERRTPSSCVYP